MKSAPTSRAPACSQGQGSCGHTESACCVVEEERNDAPERRPSPSQGSSGRSVGLLGRSTGDMRDTGDCSIPPISPTPRALR